ncbi:MAG: hypothetical protein EOS50_26030 [Mesorhizobium sp.]|nr:MAG: hypothetical protein EOS50_26030 [Mesorhizobium sp.]
MATLIATFSRAFPNVHANQVVDVAVGAGARSETIEIPGSTEGQAAGALAAIAGDTIVVLLAGADCWVAVGPTPDADALTDGSRAAWPVPAGTPYPLLVATGDSIAVVER